MDQVRALNKADWEKGIAIIRAFGRTDYMYVYEVAPWAYDAINDWIKVSIQGVVNVDITDDWARQLGQVDLARYAGAACGLLNPVHVGITVAGAIVDPRQIRALTAADIVSAAQSGVWSVGRTWTLTALDIVSAAQSGVWSVGRTWALAVATDAVAAQVSNWPALYAMNLTQYLSAACGLLNPIHVGITVAGAIVDPRSIRALTAADVVTADSLSKWGGTALTGRDVSLDLANLPDIADALDAIKVKEDAGFTAMYEFNATSGTNYYPVYLKNPAGSGKTVFLERLIAGVYFATPLLYHVSFDPTTTADGTALTIQSRTALNPVASVCSAYRTPTITADGNIILYGYSGSGFIDAKLNLKVPANHAALVRLQQASGAQKYISATLVWYEY